ncbi:hypothetical protein ACUTQ5_13620 [Serratia sp. NA_112.1]
MKTYYHSLKEKVATHPYTRRDGCLLVIGVSLLFWSLVIASLIWLW